MASGETDPSVAALGLGVLLVLTGLVLLAIPGTRDRVIGKASLICGALLVAGVMGFYLYLVNEVEG